MIKKQTTLINTGKDAKQVSGLQIQSKQKSVPEYDNIHQGFYDSKFTQLFNEGMKAFRIFQFDMERANPTFGLMDPSLLNSKYVVYKVTGEDSHGPFEGNRRYNEFFLLR